jgi:hypothetical protein
VTGPSKAGEAGDAGAEREHGKVDEAGVDAHRRGGRTVLVDGADVEAEAGFVEQRRDEAEHDGGDDENENAGVRQIQAR